jgi:hypothetical protein
MKAQFAWLVLAAAIAPPAIAQEVIYVNETFDSYVDGSGIPDQTAFRAMWPSVSGDGTALNAVDEDKSRAINEGTVPPASPVEDIDGVAVGHLGASNNTPGMVNQWHGPINQQNGMMPAFQIAPNATQAVFLSADIYDPALGNTERMSVGLRNTQVNPDGSDAGTDPDVVPSNFIELGLWNSSASSEPTVAGSNPGNANSSTPGYYPGTTFGARVALFGTRSAPLTVEPTWQFFRLPDELDHTTYGGTSPPNGIVTQADIGPGWHRMTATITETSVTLTLDFYRDGLRNTSTVADEMTGERPGSPGYDAVMVWPIAPQAAGFNNLRFGGPSGNTSNGAGLNAFDNIVLKMVPTPGPFPNADFNYDKQVDGADFLNLQRHLGWTSDETHQKQRNGSNGDYNHDGSVNGLDVAAWQSQFASGGGVVGVPEPASILLTAVALLGFAGIRRR